MCPQRYFDKPSVLAVVCLMLTLMTTETQADLLLFTNSQAFQDALVENGLPMQTTAFDQLPAPLVLSAPATIAAITFDGFGSPNLIVTNEFATTSGQNYLGADDPESAHLFLGGYALEMTFQNSKAIGFFVITSESPNLSIFDNDIELLVPGIGSAFLDVGKVETTVGDSDNVFFIGLIDTQQTFTNVQILYSSSAVEAITFNIDDIQTSIEVLLGDVNRDNVVNLLDIAPFVNLLSSGEFQLEADTNLDGIINLLDVAPFVEILSG